MLQENIHGIANTSGELTTIVDDRGDSAVTYSVIRRTDPDTGDVTISLMDRETSVIKTPDQAGIPTEDIASTEANIKSQVNNGTPTTEAKAIEYYTSKMGEQEARIQAKMYVHGMSRQAAEDVVAQEFGEEQKNFTKGPRDNSFDANSKYEYTNTKDTDTFRVKLRSKQTGEVVVFYVSPNINESRSVSYETISPVHHPGSIQVYKTTNARNFNVNGKLVSRTRKEATQNMIYMNLLRSWTMPYYGKGTANNPETMDKLGAPPDILNFRAYGRYNLENIPVILTSYSWTYPDNVDYLPTLSGDPFPVMVDLSLMMVETYSPDQFENFDLTSYKLGIPDRAFRATTPTQYSKNTDWNEYVNLSDYMAKTKK